MATDDNDKPEDTSAPASDAKVDTTHEGAEKVAVADAPAATTTASGGDHSHDDEPLIAEPDRVNVGIIGAVTLAIVVATVAVVVGVREFFSQTLYGEVSKKVLEPEDPAKRELAAVEVAKLSKYQWVNQKDGVVRIPVARARELVLAEYGSKPAYAPKPANSGPTDTSPAPESSSIPGTTTSASAAPDSSAAPAVSGMPSGTPAPSGSVAPEASTLKPGLAPSASASAHH